MPPPRSNFEKLQDLLWKLKRIQLDVSSSGALAASLDACVVSPCPRISQYRGGSSVKSGPERAGIQHTRSYNGDAVHAIGRVFLLGERVRRYIWTLRARESYLHSFH